MQKYYFYLKYEKKSLTLHENLIIIMRYRFILFILLVGLLTIQPTKAQFSSSPKHEVRAMWLTTIGGIDWPRSSGQKAQKLEMISILDQLKAAGINTVLFQARVRGTTMYPSKYEPWETCLTGTPGKNPGYDPLKLCIDLCHERGMECHAWVVTIPMGNWNKIGCKTMRQKHPNLVKRIGDDGFMDPENTLTGDYLVKICREIVDNYDVDGIHLDYIRYPETWPTKLKAKKTIQQRRNYITDIVRKISHSIKPRKPWIKFSCSPIGKYDNLRRYSAGGWNAHTAVSQDAQLWLKEGLMDELFPMMYFRDNNFFPFAIDWKENSNGRLIVPGLGIYFLDPKEGKWELDQVARQMNVCRQIGVGHCYFRSKFFTDNTKGIYDYARAFDATLALVPPMTWATKSVPSAPKSLSLEGTRLHWGAAHDDSGAPYLLYNVYASDTYPVDITKAENLVAVRQTKTSIQVPAHKYYAVTAMNRFGIESKSIQLHHGKATQTPRQSTGPDQFFSEGNVFVLPTKENTLDAKYIIIETLQGQTITIIPYTRTLDVKKIPNGIYQLRSLGRNGRNHRIGFLTIKRP